MLNYISQSRAGKFVVGGLTGITMALSLSLVGCVDHSYDNEQQIPDTNLLCSWNNKYSCPDRGGCVYTGIEEIRVRKIIPNSQPELIGTGLAKEKVLTQVTLNWSNKDEVLRGLEVCAGLSEPKVKTEEDNGCGK